MDYLNNLLAPSAWSSGFWPSIIKWFAGVGSIGLAIILMTVCIKIILFPLDFWQKRVSRKMAANQAIMKPELDEIQQKYANNPQVMRMKQQEVYRKYNGQKSASSGCVAMLVYMIVTMVVFFSLFGGLRSISQSQINYEYYTLQQTYVTSYQNAIAGGQTEEEAVATAQTDVATQYGEIREGFLTIKNIWRPDSWVSVFPNGNEFLTSTATRFGVYTYTYNISETEQATIKYIFLSTNADELTDTENAEIKYVEPYVDMQNNIYAVKDTADGAVNPTTITIGGVNYSVVYPELSEGVEKYEDAAYNTAKAKLIEEYDLVTAGIQETYKGQWNGYLILVLLAGAITFLSSWFANLGLKTKDEKGNIIKGAKPKPTMGVVLAFVMIFFTISYTSAFAIYIITNSAIGMLLNYLSNIIMNKLEDKKEKKEVVADYVRR